MKVLIADDEPASNFTLETRLLNWGYDIVNCRDGQEAWNALKEEGSPNLIILDWMMPGMSGLEVCAAVRKLAPEPYKYIILLTARNDKKDIIQGLEAGADDYISKPYDEYELKVRLRAARRILELQEQFIETRDTLEKKANYDALTGVLNRHAVEEALEIELDRSVREKKCFSAAMVDIDHFKNINDTYGHLTGDEVLRETVKRLRSSLRLYDSIGRWGGEEFLVIFSGSGPENAVKQAERLRETVDEKAMDTSEGLIGATISVGLSAVSYENPPSVKQIVKNADNALYKAKENGRNRVEIDMIDNEDCRS